MRNVVSGLALLILAGCSILEDEVGRGYAQRDSSTPVTFTTADVRMIAQRRRPNSPDVVTCTEPSPDVAKALSAAAQLSGSGGNGTATGNLSAGGASAEAVVALAGRSTALLGLRDGLYRACEAYANGAIGADAYALVLSRYGQLMTTLFLGQDVTGAAGTQAGGSVTSPPVSVTINPSGASTITAGQAQNPSAPTPSTIGTPASTAGQAQNPSASTPSTAGTQASTAGSLSAASLALARMNEDYLNLGYGLDALVIACVNYADPTRLATPLQPEARPVNWWLQSICPQLSSLTAFSRIATAEGALVRANILAPPVNPAQGK
jgi:hypothetical protein